MIEKKEIVAEAAGLRPLNSHAYTPGKLLSAAPRVSRTVQSSINPSSAFRSVRYLLASTTLPLVFAARMALVNFGLGRACQIPAVNSEDALLAAKGRAASMSPLSARRNGAGQLFGALWRSVGEQTAGQRSEMYGRCGKWMP
jgi:hypothetical protein